MVNKLFGTDGMRGKANSYPLTVQTVMKLAQASGAVFKEEEALADKAETTVSERDEASCEMSAAGRRPLVIVGKDTRISCDMLEAALCAGLNSVGYDAYRVGVLPTPAVSSAVPFFHGNSCPTC